MEGVTRRRFLGAVVATAGLCAGARAWAAPGSLERLQGCFLRAAPGAQFLDDIRIVPSSGDAEADQVCKTADANLRRVFRVAPEMWFFDDGSEANAYATPLTRPGSVGVDGTVLIGLELVKRVSRRNELNRRWQYRLTGFVAHEWAHIVQQTKGYRAPGKSAELHADFLAGWFLGRTAGTSGARDEAMYRFYFLGDDAFDQRIITAPGWSARARPRTASTWRPRSTTSTPRSVRVGSRATRPRALRRGLRRPPRLPVGGLLVRLANPERHRLGARVRHDLQ